MLKAKKKGCARPVLAAEDRLTALPEELRTLIVREVSKGHGYYIKMPEFFQKEKARLGAIQSLRLTNVTISRMHETRLSLYDVTSSLWAVISAMKIRDNLVLDLMATMLQNQGASKMEMLMYLKEREAYFAFRKLKDLDQVKRYLVHYKSRVSKVDKHLQDLHIFYPPTDEHTG